MTQSAGSEQSSVSETYESAPDGGIMSALKGMFSFFTALPVNIGYKEMKAMDRKFWLVPVVGLFYGILGSVLFVGLGYFTGMPLLCAAVTIFAMHLMNRLLHIDGLIDIGDGLTVAGRREDHLRALKDTTIGAGGMATGMLVTLILLSEYASTDLWLFPLTVLCAEICARNAQVSAAAFGIASNGMAGNSVRATDGRSLVKSTVLTVILLAISYCAASALLEGRFADDGSMIIGYILALIVSIVWGRFMAHVAVKNFGAVNGDVLGATNESARVLCYFAVLVSWSVIVL